MRYTREEIEQAKKYLLEQIKPGDELYTILRSVSRSGMSRHISVLHGTYEISHLVTKVLEERRADDGGLVISGCGMDMGFEVVYNLGRALYPDGFTCVGQNCHSNDHRNGDRNYKPHHHNDGGYAFEQRWL